jgi:hypothetical protein
MDLAIEMPRVGVQSMLSLGCRGVSRQWSGQGIQLKRLWVYEIMLAIPFQEQIVVIWSPNRLLRVRSCAEANLNLSEGPVDASCHVVGTWECVGTDVVHLGIGHKRD